MKNVVILGSTGSVGKNALRIISEHKDSFRVIGLTAFKNAKLLASQNNAFKPKLIALGDTHRCSEINENFKNPGKVLRGEEGVSEVACMKEADVVVVAISGASSVKPLLAAIKAGKRIALANKESIVAAGEIIMNMARRYGAEIIPVDSEHNSIFQCLQGEDKNNIRKIYLMGTGGPLRDVPARRFDKLRPSRILKHPVWRMGKKISVDSATMMNKGLEIIEASHLFGVAADKIEVLFHPEAIIHSMIEFKDRNVIANLFCPDMRFPIFYALNYPKRVASRLPKIDFAKLGNMSFKKPDHKKFPALELSYRVARLGGTYPACLNAANEGAVELYLKGKIKFTDIIKIIKRATSRHRSIKDPSLEEILYIDRETKMEVGASC